ncbi:hypothetical protein HDU93_008696 [Gonapodya sp. JEL0774]|nr:hypothetical protein HDU93_008696 [Gonapodya sp. JEL0774]
MSRTVIIAVDKISDEGFKGNPVVDWAVKNHVKTGDTVVIMHASKDLSAASGGRVSADLSADVIMDMQRRVSAAARTKLENLNSTYKLGLSDVNFTCEIIKGPPAETIVDRAEKLGADAIVVGSRGLGAVQSHEATQSIVAYGVKKGRQTVIGHVIVRSFLAGAFIAFGGLFAVIAGGGFDPAFRTLHPGVPKLLYGLVFPVGLVAVVLEGGELFTSNVMYLAASVLERRASLLDLLKNWLLSWTFNFTGALFVAYFLTYLPDVLAGANSTWGTYIVSVAHKKVSADFGHLVLKGIGCNWLVCLAVCFAITAESVEGKILGIYLPIWAFVTCGFEHSIANMFFIPTAMLYAPDQISTADLFLNLIPVTIGNIIGGSVFVALPSWYLLPSSGPFAHTIAEKPVPLLPLHVRGIHVPWHAQLVHGEKVEAGATLQHMELQVEGECNGNGPGSSQAKPMPSYSHKRHPSSPVTSSTPPSTPSATVLMGEPQMPLRTGLAIGLSTQSLGMRSHTWGHAPGSVIGQAVVPVVKGQADVEFWDGIGIGSALRQVKAQSVREEGEPIEQGGGNEGEAGDGAKLVNA